jgi:hypothetical protein
MMLLTTIAFTAWSQEYVSQTFKDTRVINTHSVETLAKRKLDVRIAHRFGDFAGDNGGFQTLFGLENASDVLIGAEYGVSNNFTVGLYRSKGAGVYPNGSAGLRQLLNGILKFRFLRQTEGAGSPVTITFVGVSSLSTAEKVEGNPDIIRSFPKFAHRMANTGQLLIARKFSEGISLQLIPSYTYRNLVAFDDENGLFSLGVAARVQVTKVIGLIADATIPFQDYRGADSGFYPAIGVGFEFDTGGHIFQLNFTNATAVMETDYIPYTTSSWGDGEFRLGFTISRVFNL